MTQQILKMDEQSKNQLSQFYGRGGLDDLWGRRNYATKNGFMTERNGRLEKSFTIENIYDMMRVDYPHLFDDALMNAINKDAPMITTTTGAYVAVHGSAAVSWVIQEANALGLIGMTPWNVGGFRAITAAAKTADGGVTENANIPATLKPTLANVSVPIKEIANSFDTSSRLEYLSRLGLDNVWNEGGSNFAAQRTYHAMEHSKLVNRMLLKDNETLAAANAESIDRAIGSKSEIDGVGQTAGDLDIYGLDRDSVTTHDAYVNHGSATDRSLTTTILKDMVTNVQPFWGGPGTGLPPGSSEGVFWLTGHDTKAQIEKLFEAQSTYKNLGMRVNVTLNGVQSLPFGAEAGFLVNQLYGFPLFVSNDVPKDTISRIYLINGRHMTWKAGILPQFFSAGMNKGTPIELGRFGNEGMFYQAGELWVDRFNVHAKGRDLQT